MNRFLLILLISPLCFAGELDKDLASRINKTYFDLTREGVSSFSCTLDNSVMSDVILQMKAVLGEESQLFKDLANLSYRADFKEGATTLTPSKVDNSEQNPAADQVLKGMEQMYSGFFEFWIGLMNEPMIDLSLEGVASSKNETGYTVTYDDAEQGSVELTFNDELLLTFMKMKTGPMEMVVKPQFQNSPKGKIISYANLNINNAYLVTDILIEYGRVGDIPMPTRAIFKSQLPGRKEEFTIDFSDYKINGEN